MVLLFVLNGKVKKKNNSGRWQTVLKLTGFKNGRV